MSTPRTPGMPGAADTPASDSWATTAGPPAADTNGAGSTTSGSDGSGDTRDQAKQAAGTAADEARQTAGTAAEEARQTAGTAAEQGRHVADVAKGEAQNVVQESKQQAQHLLDEARSQLDEQSRTQRDRLVGTLTTFGDDIEKMANGEQTNGGMAQDLARQVAQRARDLGNRIDGREPVELLDEVRSFARRRPGTFLLGALAAGVVAGRLTRGAKQATSSDGSSSGSSIGVYDDVRGTATPAGGTAAGAPTAGVAAPDVPAAYPAGSAVDEPGTTMEQNLGTTGIPDADPAADSPWSSGGRGTA